MRSLVAVFALAFAATAFAADLPAPPLAETIKLHKAGLSPEVVVAYIENREAFRKLTSDEIVQLKQAGLSERAIEALVRRGGKAIEVQATVLREYEVPSISNSDKTQEYLSKADYERAETRTVRQDPSYYDENVRYVYVQPSASYSYYSSYPYVRSYSSYHYPYSYYRAPYYARGYYYPRSYHFGHSNHYKSHHFNRHHHHRGHHHYRLHGGYRSCGSGFGIGFGFRF